MKKVELNSLTEITGGGRIANGICVGLGASSVVYAVGAATNFWNPVGWVSISFIAADAACVAYAASQLT